MDLSAFISLFSFFILNLVCAQTNYNQYKNVPIKRSDSATSVPQNTREMIVLKFNNFVDSIDQFSTTLLMRTLAETGEKNVIVSPFSMWTLLTLLSEGADGETYDEMANTLRHIDDRHFMREAYKHVEQVLNSNIKSVYFESFNDIFHTNELKFYDSFTNLVKQTYKADYTALNFLDPAAVNLMNQKIENQTRGLVQDLFKKDDVQVASMILTNSIFFKGKWSFPFDKNYTKEQPFYDDNNRQIGKVNLMVQEAPFAIKEFQELDSDIIEIPYGEVNCNDFYELDVCYGKNITGNKPRYSMVVVLPYEGVTVEQVLQKLSSTYSLRKLFKTMDADPLKNSRIYDLYLPRFKMSSDVVMTNTLKNMGMTKAFDYNTANFSKIGPNNRLWISKLQQKAIIEVNEEGAEAAAASAGILVDRISPGIIKINKPFIYSIVEKSTNTILFVGTYGKPSLY